MSKESTKEYWKTYSITHKEEIKKCRLLHREKKNEKSRKYYLENKEKINAQSKKYRLENKEKINARVKAFNLANKEEVSKRHIVSARKYRLLHPEQEKIRKKVYSDTPTGKINGARRSAKRRNILSFNPLNKWFQGAEGHHITVEYVIFIPKELHRGIRHSLLRNRNMKAINAATLDYLFRSATI